LKTQNAVQATDVNLLRKFDKRLKETIANLEKIPNFPGFGIKLELICFKTGCPEFGSCTANLQAAESLATACTYDEAARQQNRLIRSKLQQMQK